MDDMLINKINKIAIIGTGVIGASWAAFFLSKGLTVRTYDPASNAQEKLIERVKIYLQDLIEMKDVHCENSSELIGNYLEQLSFHQCIEDAVKDVDFIQENGPEKIELKQDLYRQITQFCPKNTIIASSSSGLKISDIQNMCIAPERVVLGHPFNPPHLLPLVEVLGGNKTDSYYVQQAINFYKFLGKRPILLNKEVKGHVANRLQGAIWREAFYLVNEGVCKAEDIDIAISNGPGLRWAIFGPYLNMELANHLGFMGAMHHLGGPMSEWWADMKEFTLSEEKIKKFNMETEEILKKYKGRDIRELRDIALLNILHIKQKLDIL